MKIIIAGSRNFNNYELMCNSIFLDESIKCIDEIVSGTANGADKLGEKLAINYGIPVKLFPANWDKFGKSAGYIRNEQMAKYADSLFAFWDGKSKGTKHMIDLANKYNLKVNVIIF